MQKICKLAVSSDSDNGPALDCCGAYGQQMPAEYDQVLKTLGKQGDSTLIVHRVHGRGQDFALPDRVQ